MAHEPVARRTRLRRSEQFESVKEMNKKARKAARREWKEKQQKTLQIYRQNHGSEEEKEEEEEEEEKEEEEDEDFVVLDAAEYQRIVNSKKNNRKEDLGFEEDGGNYVGFKESPLQGFEENGKAVNVDGLDVDESDDDSCTVLGERFCAWDNDDDDDDDDLRADEESCVKKIDTFTEEVPICSPECSDSSGDEDDDPEDDKDFRVVELESSSTCVSKSGSDEEILEDHGLNDVDDDDECQELKKQKHNNGRKKARMENSEFSTVFEGLNLASNPVTTELTSIAHRTRSHWRQKLPKTKAKQGKINSPITVQDISSTDGEYDDSDEDEEDEGNIFSKTQNPNPNPDPVNNGGNRKRGRPLKQKNVELPPSLKKKKVRGFRDNELQRILRNTLSENGDGNLEDYISSIDDNDLPLKFKFGVEKIAPPEKSEEDLELEKLWKELELFLSTKNIGKNKDYSYEDFIPSESAVLLEKNCAEGRHHLIYDIEVGIVCKFCSYVKDEIKYCIPDFNNDPFGKGENRGYGRFPYDGEIASHQFQFHDDGNDANASEIPSESTWGTVWDLIPGTKGRLYPHQQEGFEFIWRNVAGGIKFSELRKPTKSGDLGGCIICHAPGTGKTRLAIVFLQSYIKQYPTSRPVIIAPSSVLLTWEEEFTRWKTDIRFFNMNRSDVTREEGLKLKEILKDTKDMKTIRLAKLCAWINDRAVLGISYSLFEKLTREREDIDVQFRENLLEKPRIVMLDEGHTPRNDSSFIWKALSNVRTRMKIILSGTPFQNNFQELYNTIALVREEFVERLLAEAHRDYPRKHGRRCALDARRAFLESVHSSVDEGRRIEELRTKIKPFVHVYTGGILRQTLPGLLDSVLVLKPSTLQRRCFKHLASVKNSLELDYWVALTSFHPSLLKECERVPPFVDEEMKSLLRKHKMDLDGGVKTRFLFEFLKLTQGEKVLVFSQYINPLKYLRVLLEKYFNWAEGMEILYMDGKQDAKLRQNSIRKFNDPNSEVRVLLASTKACSEGIHLVGASRVVLLDVVWNPSVERQAISRAYRLGQKKNVHVYHLITSGTQECDKYYRMLSKERYSEMVFSASESEALRKTNTTKSTVSEDRVLDEMINHDFTKAMFEKIIYQPKADDFIENFGC